MASAVSASQVSSVPSTLGLFEAKWAEGKHVCVGLDLDPREIYKIPAFQNNPTTIPPIEFAEKIVQATSDIAGCYKINRGFFAFFGDDSFAWLKQVIKTVGQLAPQVPIILDSKYGDIGNSNRGYLDEAFRVFGADATTVHSWLGGESFEKLLTPEVFLFVLCRTSNPGAKELQERLVLVRGDEVVQLTGLPLQSARDTYDWYFVEAHAVMRMYQYVALRVDRVWNTSQNFGLVVGATAPEELAKVREVAPDIPLLIPGVGKQGGSAAEAAKFARHRFFINSSSGIIYASSGNDFADVAREKALELDQEIRNAISAPEA